MANLKIDLDLDDVLLVGDSKIRLLQKSGRRARLEVIAEEDTRVVQIKEHNRTAIQDQAKANQYHRAQDMALSFKRQAQDVLFHY